MRPPDNDEEKPKPPPNPIAQAKAFPWAGRLGRASQQPNTRSAGNGRTSGPPPGGYGNRGNFNYKKNEDRSTDETKDVNRGASGFKRGISLPEQKRGWRDFRTEQQRSALERRFRTTRST